MAKQFKCSVAKGLPKRASRLTHPGIGLPINFELTSFVK